MWKSEGHIVLLVILYSKNKRSCQYTFEVVYMICKSYDET